MKNLLLITVLFINCNAAAQTINNKLSFKKGQRFEVTSHVTITPEEPGAMAFDGIVTRQFDVQDAGTTWARLEHKVKRVLFKMTIMGETENFDSEKEADLYSPIGKTLEKNIKNKYNLTVDATGKITGIKSDDDHPNKHATGNSTTDVYANTLNSLIKGLELPQKGDETIFTVLPVGELKKGFSWKDTANTTEKGIKTFTISDINEHEIIIDIKGTHSTENTQEMLGFSTTISSKAETTGTIKLDTKTGILKEENISIVTKGNITGGGQNFPINNTVSRSTIVKTL